LKVFLGTAQFGFDYGVTNTKGQILEKEAFELLDFSLDKGIKCLDTAYAYGESEKVLGRYGVSEFEISTKLPPLKNYKNLTKHEIINLFYESLNRLNVEKIQNLFIHDSSDLNKHNRDSVIEALSEIKDSGLVNSIGVSIYGPDDIFSFAEIDIIDIIQTPLNVLDNRILNDEYMSIISSNNIKLQARSIYLQGLLLQQPESITKHFIEHKNVFIDWHNYIEKIKITKLEGCINYLRSIKDLHSIVVGVTSISEFKELNSALSSQIRQIHFETEIKNDLIDPRTWT